MFWLNLGEIPRGIPKLSMINFYVLKMARPAGNYMLKVNNRNTRTRCEICSKLIIKTPERRLSLLLTLNIFHILLTLSRERPAGRYGESRHPYQASCHCITITKWNSKTLLSTVTLAQLAFTCSKLTMETPEQCLKSVKS